MGKSAGERLKEGLAATFGFIKEWGTAILSGLLIVCAVVLWTGVASDPGLVIALGSTVILGVVLLQHQILGKLDTNRSEVRAAVSTFTGDLMHLDACQEHLRRKLGELSAAKPVELQHLGIDMAYAWSEVSKLTQHPSGRREISFKILMVDPETTAMTGMVQLNRWVTNAALALDEMQREVPTWASSYGKLSFEVRGYHDFPYIHGFSYSTRGKRRVRYFSFCRWEGGEVKDWGKDRYRKVEEGSHSVALQDLAVIYETAFDRLWSSGRVLWRYAPEEAA